MNKKKLITIIVIGLTIILAIFAAIIAYRLYKIGKKPAPIPSLMPSPVEEALPEQLPVAPELPCQLTFTVPEASPSESPEASPSASPEASPSESPEPSPREIVLTSPSPTPQELTPASPLPEGEEPAEELISAGTSLPTIIIATGGLLLIALGLLL